MLTPMQNRTWAEVDIDAVKHNFKIIKNSISNNVKVCCVIKANAYGHGAIQLAKVYQENNADFLAVSNIEEALQLRNAGIFLPILILGFTDPKCAEILAVKNISQCVYSKEYGRSLSNNAVRCGVSVKVHIKLDTGMGRIGFKNSEDDVEAIADICKMAGIIPEGIFTHFASADEGYKGKEYTVCQYTMFMNTISKLEEMNIRFEIRHCANSAAIFDYPEMHLDMVRAGIVLYGLQPSAEIHNKADLKPLLKFITLIDHIKTVKAGEHISYGRTYTADKERRIATIPIGYADGLWRANSSKGLEVKIGNSYAHIVGRICMDQCMIDITDIPEAKLGSSVTVYDVTGRNTVDQIAKNNDTINYEIVCAIGERVPRVYKENNKIITIADNLI